MLTVIVGQRGVGKSHFLKRIQSYFLKKNQDHLFTDLDSWIEQNTNQTISQIFKTKGESHFRELEKRYYLELETKYSQSPKNCYLAVGGGFDLQLCGSHTHILWVQRDSDEWGRIFTDRPRLDPQLPPILEFLNRARERQKKFSIYAWEEYLMPEGLQQPDPIEEKIILNEISDLSGILTLQKNHLSGTEKWNHWFQKHLSWGLDFFELRDDLLSREQVQKLISEIPKSSILYSLRTGMTNMEDLRPRVGLVDCDLSLTDSYQPHEFDIVSVHNKPARQTLHELFQKLEQWEARGHQIKLALVIDSFIDLKICHEWQQKNPQRRSFLPRSENGRWHWYRLYMKGRQKINFIKEGLQGSASDQPSLYLWLKQPSNGNAFGALLGSPVKHSWTPMAQYVFFKEQGWSSTFAIDILDNEFKMAVDFLRELGLHAAAVTSPLKKAAYALCHELTDTARNFEAVNTLFWEPSNQIWIGHNTDGDGLAELSKDAGISLSGTAPPSIAVWGGGGTLSVMKNQWSHARFYSAQTGLERSTDQTQKTVEKNIEESKNPIQDNLISPEYFIWAAPNEESEELLAKIPRHWRPKCVVDLNYREDSTGRELALYWGARYVSGVSMFLAQAQSQRDFWRQMQIKING